MEASSCDATRA